MYHHLTSIHGYYNAVKWPGHAELEFPDQMCILFQDPQNGILSTTLTSPVQEADF